MGSGDIPRRFAHINYNKHKSQAAKLPKVEDRIAYWENLLKWLSENKEELEAGREVVDDIDAWRSGVPLSIDWLMIQIKMDIEELHVFAEIQAPLEPPSTKGRPRNESKTRRRKRYVVKLLLEWNGEGWVDRPEPDQLESVRQMYLKIQRMDPDLQPEDDSAIRDFFDRHFRASTSHEHPGDDLAKWIEIAKQWARNVDPEDGGDKGGSVF